VFKFAHALPTLQDLPALLLVDASTGQSQSACRGRVAAGIGWGTSSSSIGLGWLV